MILLSNKLAEMGDGMYRHFCPGCNDFHYFNTIKDPELNNPTWTWNGEAINVTIFPSMLIYTDRPRWLGTSQFDEILERKRKDPSFEIPYERHVLCHYWLTNGKLIYLNDSAHSFKGQTVDLPDLPGLPK